MTTNLERGDIDSVCKCFFNYIRQVAAAFGVDPQSRTELIFKILGSSVTLEPVTQGRPISNLVCRLIVTSI